MKRLIYEIHVLVYVIILCRIVRYCFVHIYHVLSCMIPHCPILLFWIRRNSRKKNDPFRLFKNGKGSFLQSYSCITIPTYLFISLESFFRFHILSYHQTPPFFTGVRQETVFLFNILFNICLIKQIVTDITVNAGRYNAVLPGPPARSCIGL